MKIENIDDKVIVYVYNESIDIDDIDELKMKIKCIFIRIMKRSNYNFFGYNRVSVYHNSNYGIIIEVEKLYDSFFYNQTIDLKITVYKDVTMYLEFDDVFYLDLRKLKYKNGKYYLMLDEGIDIYKYIEYGKIKYKKITK